MGIRECAADLEGFLSRGLAAIDEARIAAGEAGVQQGGRVRSAMRKGRGR